MSRGRGPATRRRLGCVHLLLSTALMCGCRSPVRVHAPSFEEVSTSPETSVAAVDCEFSAAVADDDLPAVTALLYRGCSPNQGQPGTDTPLHLAARNSQKDMTRLLLEAGADPNATNLLVPLSQDTDTSLVELLLKHGARVNEPDPDGQTPLHAAASGAIDSGATGCDPHYEEPRCWRGYTEMVRTLLSHGADPNAQDPFGATPLHWAIEHDRNEVAWILLHADGAKLSIADDNGWTPLHVASRRGSVRLVEWLLSQGVNPSPADASGATPLHMTSKPEVAELLLSRGANLSALDQNRVTPLHRAARLGVACEPHSDVGRLLIAAGAPIDQADGRGWTPLHHAAIEGNAELVRLLLEAGADATAKDAHGQNPLHVLARFGNPCLPLRDAWRQTIASLVQAGTALSTADAAGRTALWLSLEGGSWAITIALLDAGASVTEVGPRGASVLHLAASANHVQAAKRFMANGASPNARDGDGKTPLHWAAAHGSKDVAKLLLESGASHASVDASGRAALDWALVSCHKGTLEMLLAAGAKRGRRAPAPPPCPKPW